MEINILSKIILEVIQMSKIGGETILLFMDTLGNRNGNKMELIFLIPIKRELFTTQRHSDIQMSKNGFITILKSHKI